MSQIISTYPIFEGSQVLTSDQLNQLSAYLDQQNRLTRSKLIGIGIVGGLQVKSTDDTVRISKGLGITSEGFLIQIGVDFVGTHYRSYSLPEGVTYKPFGFPDQDVVLWEMLSDKPEDEPEVKKLNNPPAFLNEKFVLIFLEIFDKDLKSCLGNACDDKGQDRILSIRRLLVSKADLDVILTRSANVNRGVAGALDLPRFRFKKPLFKPADPKSNQIGPFINSYQKVLQETVTATFWENLKKGYALFEPYLAKSFGFSNPFDNASLTSKISQISQSLTDAPATIRGAQYLFDFFKELALAWEEFLEAGQAIWNACPTDPSLFPLHLMLGKAKTNSESPEEYYQYRHGFVQPPIFNDQRLLKETLAQRYRRMVLIIEKLELNLLRNPSPDKYPIKITPSQEKQGLLGNRSIPYYYDIKSKSGLGNWYSLEKNWNDPNTKQLWSTQRGEVLSYDNQPDSAVANPSFLESPLTYDWEQFPFLRIEGHLDWEIGKAKEAILKLISDYNLPIHLETLHLDFGNSQDKNCGWNDLQEEYMHHRLQLLGMIRDIREILDFLQKMNKEYGKEDQLFGDKEENQALQAFELFEVWVDSMTECLEDLDWDKFQESYKKILQTLLDFILIQMKIMDSIDISEQEKDKSLSLYNGLLARVSPMIYRILDLFYFTKVQRLFLSYLHRQAHLHNSRKFSEYLKHNPGLTHEAGVYRGGTFFLLYMESSGRVIGDFSLPGGACDCHCIEACGEDNWMVLPPFARPDYAITVQNTPIKIEVMVNDRLAVERTYSIQLLSEQTEKGGTVKQEAGKPIISYEPPADFSGDDAFPYQLIDEESGMIDVGRVTVWVKSPKPKTCYSVEILACWGEKNVRAAIDFRKLDPGNSLELAIQTLLTSLGQTAGFTLDELNSNFLEETEARQQLLQCLGLLVDGMSYEEMGKAILEYQAANCGAVAPTPQPTCTSTKVSGTVMSPSGGSIPGAIITVQGTNLGTVADDKGQFSINFPNPGPTLVFQSPRFISTTRTICNESVITVILTPEAQIANPETPGVVVGVNSLQKEELIKVASARGLLTVENLTTDTNDLIRLLEDDKQEVILVPEELSLLKNDTLKSIADMRDLKYRSNTTKSALITLISGIK